MKNIIIIFFGIFVVCIISLLIFSVYLNQKAGENFIKSKKIVINPDSRKCDLSNVNNIITLDSSNVYKVPGGLLSFNTTSNSSEAGNYLSVCRETCKIPGVINCNSDNITYKNCLDLLEPPSGCTNNSKPIGLYKDKPIYATSINFS